MFGQSLATSSLTGREEPDLQTVKDTLLAVFPLSPHDILDVQPYLLRAEPEITNYQAEIDRVSLHSRTERFVELERKRNELARIHGDAVWRCAPISRLVPDILTEIFCFVRDADEYSLRDCKSVILPLAQTCRLWRQVAFSHPLLWASIKVCSIRWWEDHDDPGFHDHVARAVRFHLDRAGDVSLSICIECNPCSACDALLAVRHRWRECCIRKLTGESDARVQPAHYPSLEHLELDLYQASHTFEDSPRLRSYKGHIVDIYLPWRQLTRLTIVQDIPSDELLASVLSECGGLEFLKFDLCMGIEQSQPIAIHTRFNLPSLRQLNLTCWNWRAMASHILLSVAAPALESLEFCVRMESDILVGVVDPLAEFLSHCVALRALTLKNILLGRHDLHRVLGYVTNVEHLVWWDLGKCTSANLLRMLSPPPPPRPVPDGAGDVCEDPILPFPHLVANEDSESDDDGDLDNDPMDGFGGALLPRLSYLEISGGLSPREQLKLIEHAVVSRALRRDDSTDVPPLRHVILELIGASESCDSWSAALLNRQLPGVQLMSARAALDLNHHHSQPPSFSWPNPRLLIPRYIAQHTMTGYDKPKFMFPEVPLCRQMVLHTSNITNDCYRIQYRLSGLGSRRGLRGIAHITLRGVGNHVLCVADTIDACFQVFLAIRRAIGSADTPIESDLETIYSRYETFIRLLDKLTSMEHPTIRNLDSLQQYIDKKLAYPPIVHTLVMRITPNWSHRTIVLTQVPPLICAVRTSMKDIAALTADLTIQGRAMHERFALPRLAEVKALPAGVRDEVGWLFSQSLSGLAFWGDDAKVHGSVILGAAYQLIPRLPALRFVLLVIM
ncbi:uncharacterized protein SCHCODRAFT_02589949 [Schizophyllum commune H4-8]|uniref:Uncharacterized protein n=1 Tax=Schizophyllum commune (strain H4-8 / FGSC 9210) TaxID=578458 RepID=D8QGH8_SCHCM|nr:uncharacterized protein SCHCODRAFT_02589949 [Schizophyllum commune H4-8]KAI5888071.1 hypothetical protein SCHCODRAFT_02589949 [Schizophyllum commune H4-8]